MSRPPSRRAVLGALAAAVLAPGVARGFGKSTWVDVVEIDLGPATKTRPSAWTSLLFELEQTTAVTTSARTARILPDDPTLFEHPFAVVIGDGAFPIPDERGLEQLSRYLSYGGFLLFDDASSDAGSGFDASVRRLAEALYPNYPLGPLASHHSLFRAFFLIERPVGRTATAARVEGITVGGVEGNGGFTPLMYFRDDLSGALERGASGRPARACTPGGETQRREAMKLGVNLLLYSLTSDYKKDQAHVRELIRNGRMLGEWADDE